MKPVRLEVATGGRPVESLMAALEGVVTVGTINHVSVAHDDDCPCLTGRYALPWCTCKVVELRAHAA